MHAITRILLWILGAVLMVGVGILIIRAIKPLNNFFFGTTFGTTAGA